MKSLLIFCLISYITCNEDFRCNVHVTERRNEERCDNYQGCYLYTIGPFENATCSNLAQMHASHLCASECTIVFTENIDLIRTNSFSLLDNLGQVFLNDTGIETIQSRSFSGLPSITLIHLGRNRISKIPENTFSQLLRLEYLDLSSNRIDSIEHEAFNGCQNLKNLDLSHNHLRNVSTTIIESLFQLETLNLSRNYLESIDQYLCLHLHSLQNLILDHNRIHSMVDCSSNYNIKILSLSYNNLISLNGSLFPINLKSLNLSGNHITVIKNEPFQHLENLKVLDLSENDLTNLPLQLFTNLKYLILLDISSNNIVTLNEGVFHGLVNLKYLNLSGINSANIEASVFYSTKNISTIDISKNNMIHVDIESLRNYCPKLSYLRIDGNSFTCTDLAQIFFYADRNNILIPPGQCFNRKHLNGIACENVQNELSNSKTSNQVINYFESGFRKSSFFKFFSTFQQPSQNDIRDFVEIQKYLIKNVSGEIESTGDKISKNFMTGQENLRRIAGTDELLQKLVKTIESSEGTKKNTNLTSDLFTILDQHSQAALSAESSDMKDILASLNDLKLIFIAVILILISFAFVKLFRHLKNYVPINKFTVESQELPFMERHNIQEI